MSVEERARKIVVTQCQVAAGEVKLTSKFIDDFGADSLALVELVMAIEREFDITMPDIDALKIKTFGELVKYIEQVPHN